MSEILNPILTLVLNYGYPIIVCCIIAAYFGLPIPTNAILLAAGSFSVDGTLNIFILILLAALTAITGDLFGYYLGKKIGFLMVNKLTKKLGLTQNRLNSASRILENWGTWYIFFTRWLLTPIAVPVNIAAGMSNFSIRKFLTISIVGELIWAIIYIYLGFLFGANWITLFDYINQAPTILVLITIGIGSIIVGFRIWQGKHKI